MTTLEQHREELNILEKRQRMNAWIALAFVIFMGVLLTTVVRSSWITLDRVNESRCRTEIATRYETQFRHNIGIILDIAVVKPGERTPQQQQELVDAAHDIKAQPDPFIEMQRKC